MGLECRTPQAFRGCWPRDALPLHCRWTLPLAPGSVFFTQSRQRTPCGHLENTTIRAIHPWHGVLEISPTDLTRIGDDAPFDLIAALLRDSILDNLTVVESLLRLPVVAALLEYQVATRILEYQYEGDEVVSRRGQAVSAKSESPWLQSYCCIVLTMVCSCVSVIYAYYPLPRWVKLVTEVVIATSAIWFNSVDLVGSFMHERETSICFMVATLVISSVWYVGLEGAG